MPRGGDRGGGRKPLHKKRMEGRIDIRAPAPLKDEYAQLFADIRDGHAAHYAVDEYDARVAAWLREQAAVTRDVYLQSALVGLANAIDRALAIQHGLDVAEFDATVVEYRANDPVED